jgi:hypothetical protein
MSVVVAIVITAGALTIPSSHAAPKTNNCIASPNAAAPKGKHWYYRWDRVNHRKCWYLGQEGMPVRRDPSRASTASTVPVPPDRPAFESTVEPPPSDTPAEAPAEAGNSAGNGEVATRWPTPSQTFQLSSGQRPTDDANSTAQPSTRKASPKLAESETNPDPAAGDASPNPAASETGPNPDGNLNAQPQGEMPLIWPVLNEAELAAARAPWSMFTQDRILLLIAAVAALAALLCYLIAKLFASQPVRLQRPDQRAVVQSMTMQDSRPLPALGNVHPLRQQFYQTNAVREPLARREPIHGVEAGAFQERQRWQRKA